MVDELLLKALNLPSGNRRIFYISSLMKGHEAARMIVECKAQETIRPMTQCILEEHGCELPQQSEEKKKK
jgi:hypothetical protein